MSEETPTSEDSKAPRRDIKVVPLCLPPAMIEAMDKLAQSEGMLRGRSTIARRAIKEYLTRHADAQTLKQEAA